MNNSPEFVQKAAIFLIVMGCAVIALSALVAIDHFVFGQTPSTMLIGGHSVWGDQTGAQLIWNTLVGAVTIAGGFWWMKSTKKNG